VRGGLIINMMPGYFCYWLWLVSYLKLELHLSSFRSGFNLLINANRFPLPFTVHLVTRVDYSCHSLKDPTPDSLQ